MGDLYICPECGSEISEGSDGCPKCDSKMIPFKKSSNDDHGIDNDGDMKKLFKGKIDKTKIECPRCNALYDGLVDICPYCKKVS